MQPLPLQAEPGGQDRVGAIGEVTDAGVAQRREVHPDLVRATGLEMDLDQRGRAERLDHLVVGHAGPPARDDGPAVVLGGMTADRGVDAPGQRVRMPLHESVVDLLHRSFAKGLFEPRVGEFALGHHHQAAGAHVQAVHDALALRCSGGGDPVAGRGQPADDGRPVPARAGMGGNPDRLVHHDEIVVVVEHRQARDRFGIQLRGALRLRQLHLEPGAGPQPLGLGHCAAVQQDLPGIHQFGCHGAGQPEQAGQPGVQAFAGQAVRDRQAAAVTHRRSTRRLTPHAGRAGRSGPLP